MKKILSLIFLCILLSGCERPATLTDWSPIRTLPSTSVPTVSEITPTKTQGYFKTPMPVSTVPELDWKTLPELLPESLKGYELVSWQTGDVWNYTLITGTNRMKTFEELISPDSKVTQDGFVKVTVNGIEDLKKILSRLPQGTQVMWGGMNLNGQVPEGTVYFSYPPQEIMDQITIYCEGLNIDLFALQTPE